MKLAKVLVAVKSGLEPLMATCRSLRPLIVFRSEEDTMVSLRAITAVYRKNLHYISETYERCHSWNGMTLARFESLFFAHGGRFSLSSITWSWKRPPRSLSQNWTMTLFCICEHIKLTRYFDLVIHPYFYIHFPVRSLTSFTLSFKKIYKYTCKVRSN